MLTDNIVALNREMEPYVLQAAVGRSALDFQDGSSPWPSFIFRMFMPI